MAKKILLIKNRKIDFSKVPEKPGVYLFISSKGQKLYIGKAKNLKNRLRSYFQKDFYLTNPAKANLINQSFKIQLEVLDSEIEALIKESFLIKRYKPKYNIIFKDDKNYFFVGFSKDPLPKIIITHQTKILNNKYKIKKWIGPFVSGKALKQTLKALRKVFPFCTCLNLHSRPCLNAQIGLCLGFCCLNQEVSSFDKLKYRRNIASIKKVLEGKTKRLLVEFKKQMIDAAKNEDFEKANELKEKIINLEKIFAHKSILEKEFSQNQTFDDKIILGKTMIDFSKIKRVEGFDISIFQGSQAVGSMVVFTKNQENIFTPDKSQYRKFKIKTVFKINDPAMMGEIISRRFAHNEWPLPDLVLIDGGKGQLNQALKNFKKYDINKKIIFLALAKKKELVYTAYNKDYTPLNSLPAFFSLLLKAVRDEAHRFCLFFHRDLREKNIYA